MSAISNSLAALSFVNDSVATPAAAQAPQPTANIPTDTVHLTEAQQVGQLYNQGHSVPQIAFSLNLSVQAVNSYLNISNSSGS
jgi:DNA-binding NarL/FixJ family response regulator